MATLLAGGVLCGLGLVTIRLTDNVSIEAQNIEPVALLTRHNAKHLPEAETLVRSSDKLSISPSAELLRAVRQGPEMPPEQLLRTLQETHD